MELTVEYIPALIVAKDKEGKYIKISDANKDEIYYCPVCNGEVRERAIGSDKVQPHFYHISETNCSNESILHWMFKNWLFEKGSIFKVDDKYFNVDNFEIEKQIETPFGEYRPDLFIQTDLEEFFFEINYSNGKDKTFSDKWNYLGKRVIEVNVKELINCELHDEIPTFKTIFENGEYTKEYRSYEKRDKYIEFKNFIVDSNKEEQIKQTVEYYDWFWRDIKNGSDDDIKVCINEMKYDDAVVCTKFLKKIKCHDKFEVCKDELFIRRQDVLNGILNNSEYSVRLNKLSPRRYTVSVYKNIEGVDVGEESSVIKSIDGLFNKPELSMVVNECLGNAKRKSEDVENIISNVKLLEIDGIELEKFITVHKIEYTSSIAYRVNLILNAYSDYLGEWIRAYNGTYIPSIESNKEISKEVFTQIKRKEDNAKREQEISEKYVSLKKELINSIKINKDGFYLKFLDSRKEIILSNEIYGDIYTYSDYYLLNVREEVIEESINNILNSNVIVEKILSQINSCKNNFWKVSSEIYSKDYIVIYLKANGLEEVQCSLISMRKITEEEIKKEILSEMKKIISGHYNYKYMKKYKIIKERGKED